MATSTKWRLLITANSGEGAVPGVGELVMASSVGGSTLCFGGVAIASSQAVSFPATKAFDGILNDSALNHTNQWIAGALIDGSILPQWIGYEFPSAVSIVEYGINVDDPSEVGDPTQGNRVSAWQFQYWNASIEAWVTVDTRAQTLTPRGMDYFTITPGVAPIRITQQAVEVLRSNGLEKDIRVLQQAVEILRFNGYEASPAVYPGDDPTFAGSWFMMF